jgi:hypothetical protein
VGLRAIVRVGFFLPSADAALNEFKTSLDE